MSDNSFGKLLRVTSFGESHGPGVGCVIDGLPPGLRVDPARIEAALQRRATGRSRHTSQRREADAVRILSGVFEGVSTGTALALWIENTDARSKDYSEIARQFRPGHADYTYQQKYGLRDYRGGGRSSARETTVRVAAGVLARDWLAQQLGIRIGAFLAQLGEIPCAPPLAAEAAFDWAVVEQNPFFCPDPSQVPALENYMDALRKSGDSVGARVTVVAQGVPPGLGEPVYGKLDAELAAAMMSINAVKAVEIGAGFACVSQKGSEHRDEITPQGFLSNHAGGVLGGISSGQEVVVSMAYKPTSSIRIPGQTIDLDGQACEVVTTGRHDPCVGIRAIPIAEAMMALVLMDQVLRHRAQCGDVALQASRVAAGHGYYPPIPIPLCG